MKCKWLSLILLVCILVGALLVSVETPVQRDKRELEAHGFTVVQQRYLEKEQYYIYELKHQKTGAAVVFRDNRARNKMFSIGFAAQAQDNKGANHVLEHALMCGSQKYPIKNLQPVLLGNSVVSYLSAETGDDVVFYPFITPNGQDHQNLMDVYLDMVFHPLLLTEKNIFLREGVRREYVDGKTQYNGVALNEQCSKNNLFQAGVQQALQQLFPNSVPGYSPGGTPAALKTLTYEDLLAAYNTYYIPSNSITYLAGDIDLDASLAKLDGVFQTNTTTRPEIDFKQQPTKPQLFRHQEKSKTLSGVSETSNAGLMFALPIVDNVKAHTATQILFDLAHKKLTEQTDILVYNIGGIDGGGSALRGFVAEDVPDDNTEALLTKMHQAFEAVRGLDEKTLVTEIDRLEKTEATYTDNISIMMNNLMKGWIYTGDPLRYLDKAPVFEELRKEAAGSYFDTMLDKHYIDNPYQTEYILSPADGDVSGDDNVFAATPEKTETIKQESETFQKWANTPDDPAALAKIPTLRIDDFKKAPFAFTVTNATVGGVPYCYTMPAILTDTMNATLTFDLSGLSNAEVPTAQLAADLMNARLQEQGHGNVYAHTWANGRRYDSKQYTPTLTISISATADTLQENVQAVVDLLQSPNFLTEEMAALYLQQMRDDIFVNMNAYYFYCVQTGALSEGGRWNKLAKDAADAGSYLYYQYLHNLPDAAAAARELLNVKDQVFNRNGLSLAFQGSAVENKRFLELIQQLISTLSAAEQVKKECVLPSPIDSYSLIDSTRKDVSSVLQMGSFPDIGTAYVGQMQVLAKLMTTNYLRPQLVGSMGGYGADMRIDATGKLTVSGARAPDIKKVLDVFDGMGEYLRKLSITQAELDKFIIPAVNDLDSEFTEYCSNFGSQSQFGSYSLEDVLREREQILSTTVEDLRGYANALDQLMAQKRVFLNASEAKIVESGFVASVCENMADVRLGNITPVKNHEAYITGTGD